MSTTGFYPPRLAVVHSFSQSQLILAEGGLLPFGYMWQGCLSYSEIIYLQKITILNVKKYSPELVMAGLRHEEGSDTASIEY